MSLYGVPPSGTLFVLNSAKRIGHEGNWLPEFKLHILIEANKIFFYPLELHKLKIQSSCVTKNGKFNMVWLISSSAHIKTSKNGLIRG